MKSFRDRNPYAVGIVSVLVLGALTGGAFAVGLLKIFEHTYTLHAQFRAVAHQKFGRLRLVEGGLRDCQFARGRGHLVDAVQPQGNAVPRGFDDFANALSPTPIDHGSHFAGAQAHGVQRMVGFLVLEHDLSAGAQIGIAEESV